jgi:hypothetical protein
MITNANQALDRAARAAYQQAINDKSIPLSYCRHFYTEILACIAIEADDCKDHFTFDFERYLYVQRDHDTGEVVNPAQRALAHQITIACLTVLQDLRGFYCRSVPDSNMFSIHWSHDFEEYTRHEGRALREWQRPVPFYLLAVGVLRAEWPE